MKVDANGQPIIEESDDGLDDLIDAELPPKEETPDEVKSEEQPPTDDNEAPEEKPEEKPEEAKPEEDPKESDDEDKPDDSKEEEITFKYKGEVYSLGDLEKDEKLRERVFTGANQQTHFQDLHNENKQKLEEQAKVIEQLRLAELQRQQAVAQAEEDKQTPKITPDYLKSAYDPQVKQLVKDGWIDEDMAELYPNAVTGMISMRDEFAVRIDQLERALGAMVEHTQSRNQSEAHQTVQQQFDGIFDNLSSQGGIFEPLASEETRKEFLAEVSQKLNPELDHLLSDPSVLGDLWIASNHTKLVAQAEADYKAKLDALTSKNDEVNRRNAAGEGGGSRPGTALPKDPSEQELIAQDTWGDL